MPRSLRITLFLLLLLTSFSPPVLARMVIGITPAVMPGAGDPAVVKSLEQELSKHLGEPVQIRGFESEAVQLDWLIRFRELDAALIGHNLSRTLPAGTLIQLAELPSAVAVSHPGIAAARQETLGQAFRNLLQDERGRQLFRSLDATVKSAAAPASSPVRNKPLPISPLPTKPAVVVPAVAAPAQSPAAPSPAIPRPAPVAAAQTVKPPTATTEPPARPISAEPVAKSPAKPSVAAPTPAIPRPVATPAAEPSSPKRTRLLLAALVLMIGIIVKIVLLMRHWQQKNRAPIAPPLTPPAETLAFQDSGGLQTVPVLTHPPAPAAANMPPSPTMAERVLAHSRQLRAAAQAAQQEAAQPAAPRVTAAAKVKMNSDTGSSAPVESATAATENASPVAVTDPSPQHRPAIKRKTTSAKMAGETMPPSGDDQLIEQGQIGKIKLPALFKRCAELPQPTLLRVRSGDSETCIHFAAGQICHAYSRNSRSEEGTRQWSKLGYLMVRDGLLSETQRDQALELIERQPGLRFAAALKQLGILDIEALRHILARQAKTTVFALILFSSGKYCIETDRGAIPAEESISLQSEALIREASHHQAEWTAIRKVLPTLGTLLDFTPDGREKLEQVRLSVHQQLLLSQVDGQTSIGTLSSDSTMMDYEACRFLYLMVKAGVLRVVPAS